jgi:hypothetical protein
MLTCDTLIDRHGAETQAGPSFFMDFVMLFWTALPVQEGRSLNLPDASAYWAEEGNLKSDES